MQSKQYGQSNRHRRVASRRSMHRCTYMVSQCEQCSVGEVEWSVLKPCWHSKDLDETLPNHFRKFKIEVTCQVKVRSKVKIGCFQVADRSDLKRSIFHPKLSICTPKDQAKVLTGETVSYLAQVKVKVRSKGHQTQYFQMCPLTHVLWSILDKELDSHGYFTIWLNLNEKKCENRFKVRSKMSKKVKFSKFISWKQRHVSEAESPQQSNGTIRFPVSGLQLKKLHLNVWRHHWALWGRQKHPFWGSKIIVSS